MKIKGRIFIKEEKSEPLIYLTRVKWTNVEKKTPNVKINRKLCTWYHKKPHGLNYMGLFRLGWKQQLFSKVHVKSVSEYHPSLSLTLSLCYLSHPLVAFSRMVFCTFCHKNWFYLALIYFLHSRQTALMFHLLAHPAKLPPQKIGDMGEMNKTTYRWTIFPLTLCGLPESKCNPPYDSQPKNRAVGDKSILAWVA